MNLKLFFGMLCVIIAGTIIIISLVYGMFSFAQQFHEDIYVFPIKLAAHQEPVCAGLFLAKKNESLTFWLKVPDRRVEKKDFQLRVSFFEPQQAKKTEFTADFKDANHRYRAEQGQYYKLGSYFFMDKFDGYVCYQGFGTWTAPYNGSLVIRRLRGLAIPVKESIGLILGVIFFLIGVLIIHQERSASRKKPGSYQE